MSGPHQVLPPASTTKVDLRAQASGFFAQRRRGANVHEAAPSPKAQQATQGLYDDPEPVIIAEAPQQAPEPLPIPEASEQRYTLAQLVEKIQQRRGRRQKVVESGDPDGPDDSGWDPKLVKAPKRGAALAAGILAHQRRPR